MNESLISFDEVLKRYSFTTNQLRWLLRARNIPFVRVGLRRIFFDPEELRAWVEQNKVRPINEK
ncbi:helix-turn-helix domain-containing protein [Desulfobacterota bacterium AH_259_B03_O07]|nr:helix-turn-helix domain-containing protein [Desulfobacterota bacterium AH_259_B03_O07]